MALTDAVAVLLGKRDHLLRDDRVLMVDTLFFGPFATADGTGNKAEFVMPFAGELVEVLSGAESASAAGDFNVEVDGTDIWSADKAGLDAGAFNYEPDTHTEFSRGSKVRVDVSGAGTAVVNGAVAIVVAYYKYNLK